EKVAVIDRNFSPGAQGVWAQEIRSALYELTDSERPLLYGYIAGLGGRDINIGTIRDIYERTSQSETPEDADIWVGVKYV
ncbi:MAG: pyruvate ferredoxin oxidoreductase, partial [Deltaproteobacteria bacterium]